MQLGKVVFFILAAQSWAVYADIDALTTEARSIAKAFGSELKSTLQRSMMESGPVASISKCNISAPDIANSLSSNGWQVARTSLKYRNPSNAPNEWEKAVLISFEQKLKAGEPVAKLEQISISNHEFRYIKAIPVVEFCLKCHGTTINQKVSDKLDKFYPEDQARAYKVGDIRGAYTITKTLKLQ